VVLNPNRLLGLRQNVQEIIVGEEEEPSEFKLFLVQVFIKAFCYLVNSLIAANKVFIYLVLISAFQHKR